MACMALLQDKQYFDGRARFYFALCVAATASSKINKPIANIANTAGVDYRAARRYLSELVENGKVIRTGQPRHYEYELFEHYAWHGSEVDRNYRIAKRQGKAMERAKTKWKKAAIHE